MSLLRLFVKTSEGENIPVDASDTDCIQDVKDHLYTQGTHSGIVLAFLQIDNPRENILQDDQTLLFAGKMLSNEQLLTEIPIPSNSTLTLFVRPSTVLVQSIDTLSLAITVRLPRPSVVGRSQLISKGSRKFQFGKEHQLATVNPGSRVTREEKNLQINRCLNPTPQALLATDLIAQRPPAIPLSLSADHKLHKSGISRRTLLCPFRRHRYQLQPRERLREDFDRVR